MDPAKSDLTRRTALGGLAAGAASVLYPGPGTFAAHEQPVKIGMVEPLFGPYATLAASEIAGAQLALDQVNQAGGILGRPVQLLVAASGGSAAGAAAAAQRQVRDAKVQFLMGGASSAEAMALNQGAYAMKTVYVDTGGHPDQATGRAHHWTTFSTCATNWLLTAVNFPILFRRLGKRWYFFTLDDAFGQALQRNYTAQLTAAGGTVVGAARVPAGTADVTPYLAQVQMARPDLLILLGTGDDLATALTQVAQSDLPKHMEIAGALLEQEVLAALPEDAPRGWWTFEWWWDQPTQPHVAAFVAAYKAGTAGKVPSARSWFGFASLHAIAAAANQTKSLDSTLVAQAMEGLALRPEVALQPHRCFYNARDHQMLANLFPGYVAPHSHYPDQFRAADIVPSATLTKSAADSG